MADIERISGGRGRHGDDRRDRLPRPGWARSGWRWPPRSGRARTTTCSTTSTEVRPTRSPASSGFDTHSIRDVKALPEGRAADARQAGLRRGPERRRRCSWAARSGIRRRTSTALEQYTGVPVLTVLNVMIWAGLHAIGPSRRRHGLRADPREGSGPTGAAPTARPATGPLSRRRSTRGGRGAGGHQPDHVRASWTSTESSCSVHGRRMYSSTPQSVAALDRLLELLGAGHDPLPHPRGQLRLEAVVDLRCTRRPGPPRSGPRA